LRARLEHGLVPRDELAVGVAVARVEELPAPRDALVHLALAALDARGARRLRLVGRAGELAVGIAGGADGLAEAAEAHLHRLAAELARLVDDLGLLGDDLARLVPREVHGVPALGVAAAGEELAAPAPLDHHALAALLADEIGRALLALHVAHLDL